MLPKNGQESQDIMSPIILARRSKIQITKRSKLPRDAKLPNVLDVKNPRAPSRDPKVQEIHAIQVTKRSKCPRASSRSPHCQSQVFSCNHIYLYCKRPTVGANEPNVVKANLVQAYIQKKGPTCITKHIMKALVTCQSRALILHHYGNSPDKYPIKGTKPNFSEKW